MVGKDSIKANKYKKNSFYFVLIAEYYACYRILSYLFCLGSPFLRDKANYLIARIFQGCSRESYFFSSTLPEKKSAVRPPRPFTESA